MIIPTRFFQVILLLATVLTLLSCSKRFLVESSGNINQQVVFYFCELESKKTMKIKVYDFYIQKKIDNSKWITIWSLEGEEKMDNIIYGKKYSGLREKMKPGKLEKHVKYRVSVSGLPTTGPAGSAGQMFTVDEGGYIKPI